jgi:GH25 family lysozyme M1 (1,4-beta-N-acetylmuramidase)
MTRHGEGSGPAIQANKNFSVNQWVLVQETSNPANQMLGQITSYSGTSLVVSVAATGGSGTHADWTIVLTNSAAAAGYHAGTLMALDFEDSTSNMLLAQARAFLEALDAAIGRPAALYSGNRIKEQIAHADAGTRAFFGKHKLWLCQYGPTPKLVDCNGEPLPWARYFLWQYTGDGSGPTPHDVPGIGRRIDINHYDGSDDELKAAWAA